jgi:hypothetical protein
MLEIMSAGVVIFPGSGIIGNLADKAKKLGIPVLDDRGARRRRYLRARLVDERHRRSHLA